MRSGRRRRSKKEVGGGIRLENEAREERFIIHGDPFHTSEATKEIRGTSGVQ